MTEERGLQDAPLIHVRNTHNLNWAGWEDYFQARGILQPHRGGKTFDNYVQAVQSTHDGRGGMLGWRSISEKGERDGALRRWPDGDIDLGTGYFVTTGNAPSADTTTFLNWARAEAAQV